jgi:hypothetical protein
MNIGHDSKFKWFFGWSSRRRGGKKEASHFRLMEKANPNQPANDCQKNKAPKELHEVILTKITKDG